MKDKMDSHVHDHHEKVKTRDRRVRRITNLHSEEWEEGISSAYPRRIE
jgi:hypothetical protein